MAEKTQSANASETVTVRVNENYKGFDWYSVCVVFSFDYQSAERL